MKTFVRVHTCFSVNDRSADFDIFISVDNLSLFLQSFTRLYKDMGWANQNKDLPPQFTFDFSNYPSSFPNKLIVSGIKPDIRLMYYSRYINQILLKSK